MKVLSKIPMSTATATRQGTDPASAAEVILRSFAPRAISMLSTPRTLDDGRVLPARISANDCYVALEEACAKMARVAVRHYQRRPQTVAFDEAVLSMFPDPAAYLSRCIRSVISDAERVARREPPTVSIEQPVGGADGLHLGDTLQDDALSGRPEDAAVDADERLRLRRALATALGSIPAHYLAALERDMARDRARSDGRAVAPESANERQQVCRARAAVAQILRREVGDENPYIHLLGRQKAGRVVHKTTPSGNLTAERQHELFQKVLGSTWSSRAATARDPEANVEEAIVNEVSSSSPTAAPSPEMRSAMRVMDTYIIGDDPRAECPEAQALYDQARKAREAGRLEEAVRLYRAAHTAEPKFLAALNEVGVLLSRLGNLRDALKVYVAIVEDPAAGDHRYIAATNAADIHLTWFDAGRNRDRNMERARYYATFAMQRPTPMRACNLVLALVKDRYYREAREVMDDVVRRDAPACRAEKFLETLLQIRDADLVTWWNWVEDEMGKEDVR